MKQDMRTFYLFLLLLVCGKTFSQKGFNEELKSIIKDSVYCFASFRAGLSSSYATDSVFSSRSELGGTSENSVYAKKDTCLYFSKIAPHVKRKKGKKIVDEWKLKIKAIVGASFKLEPVGNKNPNSARYGWSLVCGSFSITIALFDHGEPSDFCFVGLFLLYKPR